MTWFRIDDGFWSHPKIVQLSDAAITLWTRAGSYSCQHLTDGHLTTHALRMVGGKSRTADELVRAGLWEKVNGGYSFHDWEHYQESSEVVLARRENARERQRKARAEREKKQHDNHMQSRGMSQRDIDRDSPREFSTPDPTRPDPTFTSSTSSSSNGSSAQAREEPPRGPSLSLDAVKLVRDVLPKGHPPATQTALAHEVGAMLVAGNEHADIRAGLELWLDKPTLGPRTLPSLVSEVIRSRDRPRVNGHAVGAATTKAAGWLAIGENDAQRAIDS